jgi:hypothetical protein
VHNGVEIGENLSQAIQARWVSVDAEEVPRLSHGAAEVVADRGFRDVRLQRAVVRTV